MITVGGIDYPEYVTTADACAWLNQAGANVHGGHLRDWKRRGILDVVRDPHGRPVRVRIPGHRGRHNVWRWRDLAAAEAAVGRSAAGRPRLAAPARGEVATGQTGETPRPTSA